jgi:prevent-host-death family protein
MDARSSIWPISEAKKKFGDVIRRAREEGPQTITVRGEVQALVVSAAAFQAWQEFGKASETILEFLDRWDGPGASRQGGEAARAVR